MIAIVNNKAGEEALQDIIREVSTLGVKVDISRGVNVTTVGMVGDVESVDQDKLRMMNGVEKILRVSEPYKLANRKFHPEDGQVNVAGVTIGGQDLCVIAGPCSVETPEQMAEVAKRVRAGGAQMMRGGAYKPRTSPYAFQGLEKKGIELLMEAGRTAKLPIVTEITTVRHIEMFDLCVDVIQVGARNMQNFELLKEVGALNKPVLLKRGLSSTIEEWLMSAEYILSRGNKNVILCERGIRTFEDFTRNTLDLSAVVAVKRLSHLPVLVDPSHATGHAWMVERLGLAAIAAGADGLLVEVHNDPANALCDGPQSLTPDMFDAMMEKVRTLAPLVGRTVPEVKKK